MPMSVTDVFLLVVRWLHALAAVAWVGGGLFYLLVLRPALRRGGETAWPINELVAMEFRGLVDTAVVVLVLTGAVLTFDRLTSRYADVPYVATLGIKVALAMVMFHLARSHRRPGRLLLTEQAPQAAPENQRQTTLRRLARTFSSVNLIVILGIGIFLLADLLKALFERALSGP
jgi:uncharacterized membrane protein